MVQTVSFTVNGDHVEVRAEPAASLLTALRETLGLKATRYGCGTEGCGSAPSSTALPGFPVPCRFRRCQTAQSRPPRDLRVRARTVTIPF